MESLGHGDHQGNNFLEKRRYRFKELVWFGLRASSVAARPILDDVENLPSVSFLESCLCKGF